jgi:hypothetical protein
LSCSAALGAGEQLKLISRSVRARAARPNEREFLWRAADTKTLLNGTAAPARMEF